jgi:hypothetical protein
VRRRLVVIATAAAAFVTAARPASAVVVNPFFAGHGTIDATTQVFDWTVRDQRLNAFFGQSQIDIDPAHGFVGDGGALGGPVAPVDWGFDFDIWGPLVSNIDL